MLALRVTRINGDWDAYWRKRGQNSSPANQNRPSLSQKSAASDQPTPVVRYRRPVMHGGALRTVNTLNQPCAAP